MNASEDEPKWAELYGADPDFPFTESMIFEHVRKLVEVGWRVNHGANYTDPVQAYAAGRNWMIDVIRLALEGKDVSEFYPTVLEEETNEQEQSE